MKRVKTVIHLVNLPRIICNHLVSKEHNTSHRLCVGSMFVVIGVGLAQVEFSPVVHFFSEAVGYMIHGLGAVPFIDLLIKEKE